MLTTYLSSTPKEQAAATPQNLHHGPSSLSTRSITPSSPQAHGARQLRQTKTTPTTKYERTKICIMRNSTAGRVSSNTHTYTGCDKEGFIQEIKAMDELQSF
ncbi:hypothetical protein LTR70_007413 [Exophiala xenobiotica]|nr:hypothetical protein LTR70_007413 [Exophiala xenobiotica]